MALTRQQWEQMTQEEQENGVEPCTDEERTGAGRRHEELMARSPELQRIRREFAGFLGATLPCLGILQGHGIDEVGVYPGQPGIASTLGAHCGE